MRQPGEDVEYSVLARGLDSEPQQEQAVLQDYFNLHTSLTDLSHGWAQQDPRFEAVAPYFPGSFPPPGISDALEKGKKAFLV